MIAAAAPSTALGGALKRSHVAVRQVFAFDSAGSPLYGGNPLPIIGGSLRKTWTSAVRTTATLTLPATPQLVPTAPGDMLGIGLSRLDVYMGAYGQTVRVAQLYVNRVTHRRPDRVLTLDCGDAASRLATCLAVGTDVPIPNHTWNGGYSYCNTQGDAIRSLLRDAFNDQSLVLADPDSLDVINDLGRPLELRWHVNSPPTLPTTHWQWPWGQNYLETLTALADAGYPNGWYVYPDADGVWTIKADPRAPGTSVLTLSTGPGGTVTTVEDGFDRAGVAANRYLITAKGDPYSGTYDESATAAITGDYAPANIGRVDRVVECVNYGAGWAQLRANQIVGRVATGLRKWRIEAVPYVGLEPGDTITLDETALGGPSTDLMVDSVELPFDLEGTMIIDARNAPLS